MSVGDICVRPVDFVRASDSAQLCASRLRDRMVGSLVVCDSAQRPIGMITDRDLAVRVVANGMHPSQVSVEEVMSRFPRCVQDTTSIESALAEMKAGPYRRLPVIDEQGKLTGVITLDDILNLVAKEFSEIGDLLKRESPADLATAH